MQPATSLNHTGVFSLTQRLLQEEELDRSGPIHRSTLADHPDVGPLLPRFVGRLPGIVQQLRKCTQGNTDGELKRVVHQLRGVGRTYGFAPISELASTLEQSLASGKTAPEVNGEIEGLIGYLEHIEGYRSDGAA